MNTYEGRRFAVITGGSSGIGYEFAKLCAEENFDVLVVAERGVEEAAERRSPEHASSPGAPRTTRPMWHGMPSRR